MPFMNFGPWIDNDDDLNTALSECQVAGELNGSDTLDNKALKLSRNFPAHDWW